jgi:hypothetical protein
MPINVEILPIDQLENLIENHRRQRATNTPLYLDALRELEKRKGQGLDFDRSLSIIPQAARKGRFLSYKELADFSGVDWGQAHRAIGGHLWKLVEYSHLRHGILLSAIVVNKPNIATGKLEAQALKGFIEAPRLLDYAITDEQAFLKEQQASVFAWAQKERISE